MRKIIYTIAVLSALLSQVSCNKLLDEKVRTFYEPDFLLTEEGAKGGITALYASLRLIYGEGYYYNINTTGTDEATYGQSADSNFKDADLSGAGSLSPSSCRSDVLWKMAFTYINTANGIIENAESVGLDASLAAEAKFFRAYYYFQLVQTFGGVPLDIGAGKLKYNTGPSRTSVRNTVPEVYAAIFSDLEDAVDDLPEYPRLTGCVTKNVARLVLAKANLTYGWWIENPKGIETYPRCDRQGIPGTYYEKAYDLCITAINNPGPYGLCDTFREVSLAANDRNREIMLWADHTEKSNLYNGADLVSTYGIAPENFAGWMLNWNHGTMQLGGIQVIQREACQKVGRPWTRMAPTHEAIKIFTSQDIEKDSRFDGTFTTMYYGNWQKSGGNLAKTASVPGANGMTVNYGERVLSFVPEVLGDIEYKGDINIGAGTVPGRADYVYDLNGISRIAYPALWKLVGERTDYDNTSSLGSPNAGSTRPFNILKFSDFYLTAAEAAFKLGLNEKARENILVLRKRAGNWTYKNNEQVPYMADFADDLERQTPETIALDYILDERMREFYGDGFRWFDLVRTQTWEERAGKYTISGSNWGDHTPETFTRTIEKYMYLRPIPQEQLDGMSMDDTEIDAYQNPGYATR